MASRTRKAAMEVRPSDSTRYGGHSWHSLGGLSPCGCGGGAAQLPPLASTCAIRGPRGGLSLSLLPPPSWVSAPLASQLAFSLSPPSPPKEAASATAPSIHGERPDGSPSRKVVLISLYMLYCTLGSVLGLVVFNFQSCAGWAGRGGGWELARTLVSMHTIVAITTNSYYSIIITMHSIMPSSRLTH